MVSSAGPATLYIDACAVLASSLAARDDVVIGVHIFREMILETAHRTPGLARLSRGHVGMRPEFVVFDFRRLVEVGSDVFA